jgi:hypothetical protein
MVSPSAGRPMSQFGFTQCNIDRGTMVAAAEDLL